MTRAAEMLDTYPADLGQVDRRALTECVDACYDCAQVCTACADACLSGEMVAELARHAGRPAVVGVSVPTPARHGYAVAAVRTRAMPLPRGALDAGLCRLA